MVWQRQPCPLHKIIPSYQIMDLDQQERQDLWIILWALHILTMISDSEQLPEKGLILSDLTSVLIAFLTD